MLRFLGDLTILLGLLVVMAILGAARRFARPAILLFTAWTVFYLLYRFGGFL